MTPIGWKTVVIAKPARLRAEQGALRIERDDGADIVPFVQIKTLVIESLRVDISAYLINRLMENQIGVVFCNEKHQPQAELLPYQGHTQKTRMIEAQLEWSGMRKKQVWKQIVQMKIHTQIAHLKHQGLPVPKELPHYLRHIRNADSTNREGQAARMYFKALFGPNYVRSTPTNTNAALNYGYHILLTQFNQQVVCSGYLTNLGIHHCKDDNPYNLSCDLMEPFRPFIDETAYAHFDEELTQALKAELIGCLYKTVKYDGMQMQLITAIDMFVTDVLKSMSQTSGHLKELSFDDTRGHHDGSF